ncbi:MAG: VIT domain-containing protein [Pseudomonadota bacterium]
MGRSIIGLWFLFSATHHVFADVATSGYIEADFNGSRLIFTALESDYRVEVVGDVVNVALTQVYSNPVDVPVNARYLFPINHSAAVHAMTMRVGDEEIRAVMQEKQVAEQTFEKAKVEGKSASLLTQHRPNMFTQQIANLMPGMPISVTIEYSHLLTRDKQGYELVIPMVVGPRFEPPEQSPGSEHDDGVLTQQWTFQKLPIYPPTAGIDLPETFISDRVTLAVSVETPNALRQIVSPTHPIDVQHVSSTQVDVGFAQGVVLDNRDFVLQFSTGSNQVDLGLLTHWDEEDEGYFSLLIEPPVNVDESLVIPREMVFLLDCSGSMSGLPMLASKKFMSQALRQLRPTDTFRIIRFSDSATEFSSLPLAATPQNIQRGLSYVAQLFGSGGTMMDSGIRQALSGSIPEGRMRNVVFLTDGYIGNEVEILKLVGNYLGDARLFAYGVGAGVNRYLMDEIGRVGRGFTHYFDPTSDQEDLEVVTSQLVGRLASPVLQDIELDWGDLPISDVYPASLPDLYAGDSIRVVGRFSAPAEGKVQISGTSRRSVAHLHKHVSLDEHGQRPVLRRSWARAGIRERMHHLATPNEIRSPRTEDSQLVQEITELGLRHALVTQWTSFVAVSRRVVNEHSKANLDTDVALPKVAGVTAAAYPTGNAMTGYGAPEPGVWLTLLAAVAGLSLGLNPRKWLRRIQAPSR